MAISKNTWYTIFKIIVAIATGIGGVIGVQSCI